jgi:kynurenine 3-monooxygenase
MEHAIRMPGRMLHDERGELKFQPYSSNPSDAINSVSRGGMNMALLDEAESREGVDIRFDARCVGVDLDAAKASFASSSGDAFVIEADAIVGADGAFSAVRHAMQFRDRFDYSQSYLEHGYKELHIPPASECGADLHEHDGFAMDPAALHIWPRGASMMIALPNTDRSFTCTLFWPFEGDHSFASLPDDSPNVRAFFEQHYPDAPPLMPTLEQDYADNPTSSLVTIRCNPWHVDGKVVLVGDASHAIVPFFGQGINSGFEDVRVLLEILDELGGDFDRAFPAFTEARKANADAIADMALANFVEMRDSVAHEDFLYRKRIEQTLHAAFPERAIPKYNMVSFSNVPYKDALDRGNRLERIVREVARRVPEPKEGDEDAWKAAVIEAGEPMLPSADSGSAS